MNITILILMGIIGLLVVFLIFQLIINRRQISDLDHQLTQNLTNTQNTLNQSILNISNTLIQSLGHTQELLNKQLEGLNKQMLETTGQIGQRLDATGQIVNRVSKSLGELQETARTILDVGKTMSEIQNILKAPKLRGGFGEMLLEDLLRQILPSDMVKFQYAFSSGEKVDAIIQFPQGIVPIDAKFPLENFSKMASAEKDEDKKAYRKALFRDVRKHIKDISQKYIRTDQGTFPFALMYIPAESVYYDAFIQEQVGGGINLQQYAYDCHVVPVSPNSFFAYLNLIVFGLRGFQIERGAQEILENLAGLQNDFKKFSDIFVTLGSHLRHAGNKYDEAEKNMERFSYHLDSVIQQQKTLPTSDDQTESLPLK
jgi:DNA recombination protein RmuC